MFEGPTIEKRMTENTAPTPEGTTGSNDALQPEEDRTAGAIVDEAAASDGQETPDDVSPEAAAEKEAEEELSRDLGHLQVELDALNDRHLRLAAEFTNYRRRAATELSESWDRGQADFLRHFLDGLDDLQRVGAWQAEGTTIEALVEGVDLVERKFRQALELAGVEIVDPTGEVFDPNTMEAMMSVPTDSAENDHVVQQVFQKGYLFKGHLVRAARVTVFKHE